MNATSASPTRKYVHALLAVAMFLLGVGALTVGAVTVATRFDTAQPVGTVFSWEIAEPWNAQSPVQLVDGGVPVRFTATTDPESATDTASGSVDANLDLGLSSTVANIPVQEGFTGCRLITLRAENLPPLRVLATDGTGTCPEEPVIDLFTRFGIPSGDAPVTTVTDLLVYLQDTTTNTDLNALSANYRACLQEADPDRVTACLTRLEPASTDTQP